MHDSQSYGHPLDYSDVKKSQGENSKNELEKRRKLAIAAANDLRYNEACIVSLCEAETAAEIEHILVTYRKRKFG